MMLNKTIQLKNELETVRNSIQTDKHRVSIGELIYLYQDGEINFTKHECRWSEHKKSEWIESILLGIPLAPIFVLQDEAGRWSVIDGTQRLMAIYSLLGLLENETNPLELKATDKLPSLDKMVWQYPKEGQFELPLPIKITIKRTRIDVKILMKADNVKDNTAQQAIINNVLAF